MERLILCGGGHVSLEVAHIAQRLEFAVSYTHLTLPTKQGV